MSYIPIRFGSDTVKNAADLCQNLFARNSNNKQRWARDADNRLPRRSKQGHRSSMNPRLSFPLLALIATTRSSVFCFAAFELKTSAGLNANGRLSSTIGLWLSAERIISGALSNIVLIPFSSKTSSFSNVAMLSGCVTLSVISITIGNFPSLLRSVPTLVRASFSASFSCCWSDFPAFEFTSL